MDDSVEYGLVSSVVWQPRGSELVADAAVGATELEVDTTVDFDDAGGTLELNGVRMEYESADEDAGTIELTDPLADAATAGDFVSLVEGGQVSVDYLAQVSLGEGEDIEVEIPFGDRDLWPEGQYDNPVPIKVAPDLSEITAVPGRTPQRDPAMLDQDALADIISGQIPSTPPATPIVSVKPLTRGFLVTVLNPEPGSEYLLHIEQENDSGLTDHNYPLTAQSSRYVAALSDGSPFSDADTYNFDIQAQNAAGVNVTLGLGGNGLRLAKEDSTTIAELAVDLLTSGNFTAGMALLGSLTVGTITIDPTNGILAPLANGGVFHIPVDGSPARFDGQFIARSLNVEGSAILKGLTEVAGTMRLTGKVPDPTALPGAYGTWDSINTIHTVAFGHTIRGITTTPTSGYATVGSIYGGFFRFLNADGTYAGEAADDPRFDPEGITRIGSTYYMVGRYDGGWRIRAYNSSLAYTGTSWALADTSSITRKPTIGTDGTSLYVAWADSANTIAVRAYSTAGVTGSLTTLTHNLDTRDNLGGLYVGSADFGASRFVVARVSADLLVFNSSGARQTSQEWARAGNTEVAGLVYDGTRFRHLDKTGILWDYTPQVTNLAVDVAYEFASSSGLRTLPSGRRTFTWLARSRLGFDSPPAPEASGGSTAGTLVKFLVANTVAGTLRVQLSPSAGTHSGSIETYNGAGATASGSNTFGAGGLVGTLAAETGGFTVDGTSNGSVGTGTFRDSVDARVSAIGPGLTMTTGSVGTGAFRTSVDARVSAVGPGLTMTTGDVGTGAFRTSVDARVSAVGPGLTMTSGDVGTGAFRTSVDARVTAVAPGVTMAGGSVGTGAFRDSVDARVWAVQDSARAQASAALTLTTTATDIAGATITITSPGTSAVYEVVGVFDFDCTTGAAGAQATGRLLADGTDLATDGLAVFGAPTTGLRSTVAQTWRVTGLAAGSRIIKLRASKTAAGAFAASASHTSIFVKRIA